MKFKKTIEIECREYKCGNCFFIQENRYSYSCFLYKQTLDETGDILRCEQCKEENRCKTV